MKFKLGVEADKRNIGLSLQAEKEEGESDFFENLSKALEDKKSDKEIIDVVDDEDIIDEEE